MIDLSWSVYFFEFFATILIGAIILLQGRGMNILKKQTLSYIFPAFALFLFPISSQALVDYTNPPSSSPNVSANNPSSSSSQVVQRRAPLNSSSRGQMFRLSTQFDSLSIKYDQVDESGSEFNSVKEKVDFLKVRGQFMTAYDVFLDVSYWMSPSEAIDPMDHRGEDSSLYHGNAKFLLGFNWLEFGPAQTSANIDLFAGMSIKASDSSAYGASRNDYHLGVLTSKRFYSFALGLGYEYRMTGNPNKIEELAIGDIQKFYATFAWHVSSEIQMILEGATYRIGNSDQSDRDFFLEESQSFASVTPSMNLRLSDSTRLRLGATFQTNKVEDSSEMLRARLWDIDGLYGNRLFAGLQFGI